jgi:hypothetical protein
MPGVTVRVDRVSAATRAVLLAPDPVRQVVVTRHGLVLVNRERGWTWYRWVMAGRLWAVTVDAPRSARRAQIDAQTLVRQCRETHRTGMRRGPIGTDAGLVRLVEAFRAQCDRLRQDAEA